MTLSPDVRARIDEMVKKEPVVLFMKGNRQFPQCGFSATVVSILNEYLPKYATVNVLTEPEIRDGIKTYSDWPTIPQLYVKGEFLGGCDIVKEMHANGELSEKLGVPVTPAEPPAIQITEAAVGALKEALADGPEGECLRIAIGPRFEHDLTIGPKESGDVVVTASGLEVAFDRASARKANGLVVDFLDGPEGAGFKLSHPDRKNG